MPAGTERSLPSPAACRLLRFRGRPSRLAILAATALLATGGRVRAAAAPAGPSPDASRSSSEWMDEAYRRKASHDPVGAASAFESARDAGFSPQVVDLELGYLALNRGDREAARAHFEAVASGLDPARRAQARSELGALPSHVSRNFYADTYSWDRVAGGNRSRDAVPTFRLQVHYRPSLDAEFSVYLVAQVTRDLASRTGGIDGVPQIYADNHALFGPGVMLRLLDRRLGLFFQAGPAVNLLNDGRRGVSFDARGGAVLGTETAHCWPVAASSVSLGLIPCADVYSEILYLRRFDDNVIGFGRGRAGATWLATGPVAWQLVGEARGSVDRNGDFYNNFAEVGAGPRLRLLRPLQLDLFFSVNAGRYFGRANRDPAPNPLSYLDLRLQAATYVEF